jgi:hypothetical protein
MLRADYLHMKFLAIPGRKGSSLPKQCFLIAIEIALLFKEGE